MKHDEGEIEIGESSPQELLKGQCSLQLFFILYLYDLPKKLEVIYGIKILQYADDICMYATSGNTHSEKSITTNRLKMSIEILERYAEKWRIKLNSTKTQQIIFHNHRTNIPKYTLKLNNNTITQTNTIKYLGVSFDSNGKFKTQSEDVFSQAQQKLKYIFGLRMRNAITEKQAQLLFTSLVRSRIEYAISAWWPTASKQNKKKIMNLEKKAFKISKKLPLWTPTSYLKSLGYESDNSKQRIMKLGKNLIQKSPLFLKMNESGKKVENAPICFFNPQ